MLGEPKKLLYDHDDAEVIATTNSGLILHSDNVGVSLRLNLRNVPAHRKAFELVSSGEKTALSVGVIMVGREYHTIDGVEVRMVREAILEEVSLCALGACLPAYCGVVKANGSLLADQGLKIVSDGAALKFLKALEDFKEAVRHR